MKLIETNWNPTNRQLRQFAIICIAALPLVGWFWGGQGETLIFLGLAGLLIGTTGILMPRVVKPLFLGLMIAAMPIGLLMGEVALLLIYFGVFVPIGLIFRILKRDALHLEIRRNADTYWQSKKQPGQAASYYRQS